jgi:hypothetical protein
MVTTAVLGRVPSGCSFLSQPTSFARSGARADMRNTFACVRVLQLLRRRLEGFRALLLCQYDDEEKAGKPGSRGR